MVLVGVSWDMEIGEFALSAQIKCYLLSNQCRVSSDSNLKLRLQLDPTSKLIQICNMIGFAWRGLSNTRAEILSFSKGEEGCGYESDVL